MRMQNKILSKVGESQNRIDKRLKSSESINSFSYVNESVTSAAKIGYFLFCANIDGKIFAFMN